MQQEIFDFARDHLLSSWDRFNTFVAEDNTLTLKLLTGWLDQTKTRHAYLFGARLSGCTRLLHASCRQVLEQGSKAALLESPLDLLNQDYIPLVDNNHLLAIDCMEILGTQTAPTRMPAQQKTKIEESLYEIYDRALDSQCGVLLAAHAPVNMLDIRLKDLRTRITSCLQLALRPLNDYGLERLAEQLLCECGVQHVPSGLGKLILTYCTRDSANVVHFIRTMQEASLAQRKPISVAFVRQHLRQLDSQLA